MFAKYNNILYRCVKYDNTYHLITPSPAKTDSKFREDNGGFFVSDIKISDPKLTDLFEAEVYVKYNSILRKVSLGTDSFDRNYPDTVVITVTAGNPDHPYNTYRRVQISELESGTIRYYYYKHSGKENRKIIVEDEDLPVLAIRDKIQQIVNI